MSHSGEQVVLYARGVVVRNTVHQRYQPGFTLWFCVAQLKVPQSSYKYLVEKKQVSVFAQVEDCCPAARPLTYPYDCVVASATCCGRFERAARCYTSVRFQLKNVALKLFLLSLYRGFSVIDVQSKGIHRGSLFPPPLVPL